MENVQPQVRPQGLFPSIFRFITEKGIMMVGCLVSLFVLTGIVLQVVRLQDTLHQVAIAKAQKLQLSKELAYWQDVVRQYDNYRDAYFKIAALQYQLGEQAQAKQSLEKVLALDPNFEKAKVLQTTIPTE